MHQINVTTKKFSEAVTIDLGQLPVIDAKIDFQLTDGSNPVIAENKTFAMTIGSVEGTLYKTDNDTVSYRYLKFDDNNVADSLAITMKMNGEEILNDTVSLTYQTSGGIDKDALDKKLDAPATPGTVGQVLTKTADGQEWADAPSGASWGQITGDIQTQADLANALALKQDSELAIESASGTALSVLPGKAYSWTLSGNGTLSLGDGWEAGSLSDSVVLLSPGSYSVSCSGNLTMVDPLQAGKMNLCVVRWLGDRARLYVVDAEAPGTITAQPVTASGTVGTAMSVNLADYVTVSTGANASYAMASGSTLPSGLSLSSEGVLSGTPEAVSSDSLTVDVTAAGCTPTTLALTMAIAAASTP